MLLWWFADQALQALPRTEDSFRDLVGNRTLKGKRGSKHPVAYGARLSWYHPYVHGFQIVILMAQRIPRFTSLSSIPNAAGPFGSMPHAYSCSIWETSP